MHLVQFLGRIFTNGIQQAVPISSTRFLISLEQVVVNQGPQYVEHRWRCVVVSNPHDGFSGQIAKNHPEKYWLVPTRLGSQGPTTPMTSQKRRPMPAHHAHENAAN